jgi:hypothetical protein
MPKAEPPSTKRPRGRQTKFSDKLVEKALDLAAVGATDVQIAKAIGVDVSTLDVWKSSRMDFQGALKAAKNIADQMVVASLYRRACGYSHQAIKFFCHEGEVIAQEYTQHYAPDVTACIFWLKNRQRKNWRDVNKDDQPQGNVTISMAYEPNKKGKKDEQRSAEAGTAQNGLDS